MSCCKEPGIALDAAAKSNYRTISPGRRLNQRLPATMEQLMRFQFQAKTTSYRSQFPAAQLVDRSDARLLIVDQVIVPELRNRGIGTAIMHSVMNEARAAALLVRLHIASDNDPSLRLYLRVGFVPVPS